ncbi:dicarboxylate/amino acid:cation symporter [Polymorphobacter sp.]|uniref:dicarboxylate/amino acid:cation symporter n=1 Tax=Polymorphobacter sp. TaxID=1909290 RepID=UPI003F6F7FF8
MRQSWRILSGLLLGLVLGIALADLPIRDQAQGLATLVGGLWLDALKMTIVPLVVALLIVGIASTAQTARGGTVALRSVILFIALLWVSTAIAAVLVPALLGLWPLPADTAAQLRAGLPESSLARDAVPDLAQFLRSIIPTNPIAAAANDNLLPLIVFTGLFAVALTRLPEARAASAVDFFRTVGDAMLVIVGWVLWLAPVGVFALAFNLGATVGASALGALGHYILIVSASGFAAWALAYPIAIIGGGIRPRAFLRATAPVLAVALSTQSSLASLPSMLKASEDLGVPDRIATVSLPIAVAIFRVTSPAMNLAVVIYVAHWFGIALSPTAIITGAAVAAITTIASVSLPGQVSFLTAITPIAIAMGVPLEPLALLVAVEMIPDLVRTAGNVTMDVATTTALSRHMVSEAPEASRP